MIDLSKRQKTTIAAAATVLAATILLAAVALLLWGVGNFLGRFSNVFLPLAVAGVVALILKPYFSWILRYLRHPPLALLALFVALLLPLAGLMWFLGDRIVDQVSDLAASLPGIWAGIEEDVSELVEEHLPTIEAWWSKHKLEVEGAVKDGADRLLGGLRQIGDVGLSALARLFGAVGGVVGALVGWVVLPVYVAFFLLIEPRRVEGWSDWALPFFKPETRRDVHYLVHEFVEIVVAFFRGQLLIALVQGVLFAIGFSIVGLRWGLILGLVLGFLNIIPYLGSLVGLGVALPLALFQEGGGLKTVLWVMVVFTIVQMIEGYLLTPKIMGEQTGLHPMVIIIAIFFWGSALSGILGMVLAIPLTAFFVSVWRLAREKYISELV